MTLASQIATVLTDKTDEDTKRRLVRYLINTNTLNAIRDGVAPSDYGFADDLGTAWGR